MQPTNIEHVGLLLNRYNSQQLLEVARQLKERTGCKVTAYLRQASEVIGFQRTGGCSFVDRVICYDTFTPGLAETVIDDQVVYEAASNWERRMGHPLSWLLLDYRAVSTGFFALASRSPISDNASEANHAQVTAAILKQMSFWEVEIEKQGVDLFLDGASELFAVSDYHGVTALRLCFARIRQRYYWADNKRLTPPNLKEAYASIIAPPVDDKEIDAPYEAATVKLGQIYDTCTLKGTVRGISIGLYRSAKATALKLLGYNRKRPTIASAISFPLARRSQFLQVRQLAREAAQRQAIRPGKYIYFPMHKEPEANWVVQTPEFTDQLAAIIALSLAAPADIQIVVKENIVAMGRRPTDFFEHLRRLKNVVVADFDTSTLDLQRKALATAGLAGTALMENAIEGRPSIAFAQDLPIDILDHVFTVRHNRDLPGIITKVRALDLPNSKSRSDGARYSAAVEAASFDLSSASLENVGQKHGAETIKPAVDAILSYVEEKSKQPSAVIA